MHSGSDRWPALPYEEWKDTCDTLHMWMQIVGKVKMELTPFLNEWWHIAFQLTSRGMRTGLIPWQGGAFEVHFDFLQHNLAIDMSDGRSASIALRPCSVAAFYAEFMHTLETLGISVVINTLPAEVPDPIHCDVDEVHSSYAGEYVTRWWRILLGIELVLQRFRSGFVGKSSPIHFFWGSFDLAHTRFSGRPAEPPAGGARFMATSEDQENFSCGFWPGSPTPAGVTLGEPAFYAYSYPEPAGLREAPLRPAAARFDTALGEFILPYDAVRASDLPEAAVLQFVNSLYDATAELGGWNRGLLEKPPP